MAAVAGVTAPDTAIPDNHSTPVPTLRAVIPLLSAPLAPTATALADRITTTLARDHRDGRPTKAEHPPQGAQTTTDGADIHPGPDTRRRARLQAQPHPHQPRNPTTTRATHRLALRLAEL